MVVDIGQRRAKVHRKEETPYEKASLFIVLTANETAPS